MAKALSTFSCARGELPAFRPIHHTRAHHKIFVGACSIVALLDLADEQFGCSAFVIALDRSSSALGMCSLVPSKARHVLTSSSGDLIHSLMYVSGTIVTQPPFAVDPAYVLVGIESEWAVEMYSPKRSTVCTYYQTQI